MDKITDKKNKDKPSSTKNQEKRKSFFDKNKSMISMIINTLLLMCTVFMMLITFHANRISKTSVDIAHDALIQAKRANDISEENDSISLLSFLATDSLNKSNLKLTEQSVNAQIDALIESQKQFEKTNRPYINLRDFKISNLEENQKIKIFFSMQNLGNYPARIIERKFEYFFDTKTPSENPYTHRTNLKPELVEDYIIKESPYSQMFTSESILDYFFYTNLKSGIQFLHFFGDITYINEVNNKKRKCSFYVEIFAPPSTEYKVIYIKNRDIE